MLHGNPRDSYACRFMAGHSNARVSGLYGAIKEDEVVVDATAVVVANRRILCSLKADENEDSDSDSDDDDNDGDNDDGDDDAHNLG